MEVLSRKTDQNLCYLRIAGTLILLLLTNASKSQSPLANTTISKISLDYSYGRLADNGRMFKSLITHPSQGLSLSLFSSPRKNNAWYRPNNQELDGTAFYFINLANNPSIGHLFGISRFMEFHLIGTQQFGLSIRSEMGGAYVSGTFDPTENYKNILISKHFNFLYGFALQASYQPVSLNGLGLKTGISLLHVSNGETKIPNHGLNNMSYTAGIFYRPANSEVNSILKENPLEKRWDLSVYPTIGWKEYWRYGGPKYLALSLSSELLYSINEKFMFGAGLDLFYDETLMVYSNHNEHPVSSAGEAIDGEIHLTALVNIARVQLLLRVGTPLYSGNGRYGKTHNTFGLKYNISDRFFLVMYHKSHGLFYGDNVQWGFGYSIIKGHRNYE
jgi:hypothetical protein